MCARDRPRPWSPPTEMQGPEDVGELKQVWRLGSWPRVRGCLWPQQVGKGPPHLGLGRCTKWAGRGPWGCPALLPRSLVPPLGSLFCPEATVFLWPDFLLPSFHTVSLCSRRPLVWCGPWGGRGSWEGPEDGPRDSSFSHTPGLGHPALSGSGLSRLLCVSSAGPWNPNYTFRPCLGMICSSSFLPSTLLRD